MESRHSHSETLVRTSKPRKKDSSDYDDSIVLLDCTPFWRWFGISWPHCRSLWFVKDICGAICAIFTWSLVLYAEFVIFFVMLIPAPDQAHSIINGVIFQFFAVMAVASHLKAMLTDPLFQMTKGLYLSSLVIFLNIAVFCLAYYFSTTTFLMIYQFCIFPLFAILGAVPRGNATKENIAKLGLKDGQVVFKCPKCVSIKPERAHHCSVCRRCIRKMDHHCPWVNNCVGENNQKFFALFTMYICIISCHALYMAIHHFIVCIKDDWRDCAAYSPAATTIFLIFLLFESLLFGLFTAIMFGTQMSAICSDETGIEQLKMDMPSWEKKTWWLAIKSVFGHPFSYKWFSPFHMPTHGKPEVYLYTV